MMEVFGILLIILLALLVIIAYGVGVLGTPCSIVGIIIGAKRRSRAWILCSVCLWIFSIVLLMLLIFFDVGYIGKTKRTYEKTETQVQENWEGFIVPDGVTYERLAWRVSDGAPQELRQPVFYVRFESIHLLRNYGYNFFRVPNDAGLDLVYSDLDRYLYCPSNQKAAAEAFLEATELPFINKTAEE